MTVFKLRRGISSLWSSNNPTLADGEPGWDSTNKRLKIGDGSTAWSSLPEVGGSTCAQVRTVRVTSVIGTSDPIQTNNSVPEWLPRVLLELPVTTTRWRLRVRNWAGTPQTGVINFSDAYLGNAVRNSAGQFFGVMSSPVKVLDAFATAADGSEYITPWVTDPTRQVPAHTEKVLSYGITTNGNTIGKGNGSGFAFYGVGTAAQSAATNPTGSTSGLQQPLDVRFEYEAITDLPVVLVLGDSLCSGQGDSGQSSDSPGIKGTWPGLAALGNRFLLVNAGLASYTYWAYTTATSWVLGRFDLTTTVPDVALYACGYNEANNGEATASTKTNFATLVASMRALGIKRHYACTSVPRVSFKAGPLAAGAAVAATTLSTKVAYANGDSIIVGINTPNPETRTVTGASTGNGPYTTTITAGLTNAHDKDEMVGLSGESLRQAWATTLRTLPNGINGVFEVGHTVEDPANNGAWWWPLAGAPATHPNPQAYAAMAAAINIPR